MDTRPRSWRTTYLKLSSLPAVVILLTIVILLTTCTSSPTPPPPLSAPTVSLLAAPDTLCGTATQLRLQVQASNDLGIDDPGTWDLVGADNEPVAAGTWSVRDGAVLVPFPDNAPLPEGPYTVRLDWHEAALAAHTFSIGPSIPTIQVLSISAVPGGDPVSTLWIDAPIRLFYINYAFEGGCPGAPYWISTQDTQGETICTQHGVLESWEGAGTAACYREDATALAAGRYETEIILMDEVSEAVAFEIAEIAPSPTPSPTATPRPPAVSCDALFTAAGITPEGEPFLPLSFFDWYTQAVYAGRACRNLRPGTTWHSTWMRNGTLARESDGIWEGPAEGVVWDVLTGTPGNPFVPPGTYTVTLEIAGTTSEASFFVYDYTPAGADE